MSSFYTHFKEVEKTKPKTIRSRLREAVLTGLYYKDLISGYEELISKPRIQFLYFHHLFHDEVQPLEQLIERLAVNHTFISYNDAVNKIIANEIDKPYIVFSSDDGFKNNLAAVEILNRYNISACFFINPEVIGETDFSIIEQHCKKRINFPPVEFLNWDDISEMQKTGHEIGAHTMEHINVAQTPIEVFTEDTIKSYDLIKAKCGEVKHFAYPYGRFHDFTKEAKEVVFNTGFYSCASAVRGCHVNSGFDLKNTDLCIRRDHLVLGWNLNHTIWFMANNARKASPTNSLFPY